MSQSGGAADGALFVVSAPSGAGKTSLVKAVLERMPRARMSVSYTTRPRREGEVEGGDYFFVDRRRFESMVEAGDLLEHANVFDNYYGTSRAQVEKLIASGRVVVLEIDWQGARQVREAMPSCRSVFVLPPSLDELERRLRGRKTDSDAVIARRLQDARTDMSHWDEFDYVIVNDDFSAGVEALEGVFGGAGDESRADRPSLRGIVKGLVA